MITKLIHHYLYDFATSFTVTTNTISNIYYMTFDSVTSEDTGTYICEVQNQYGGPTSAHVTLLLNGKTSKK